MITVYTIAYGEYLHGLVALVNSLRAAGFEGEIIAAVDADKEALGGFGNEVTFKKLEVSQRWAGNRKAEFILNNQNEYFVFLDADTIVRGSEFLQWVDRWIEKAPVFCIEATIQPEDWRRRAWAERLGVTPQNRCSSSYLNSGFFGGSMARDLSWLERWNSSMNQHLEPGASFFSDPDFPMPDQDFLNAVIAEMGIEYVALAPPDIWYAASPQNPFFHIGGFAEPVLSHCTGKQKPWLLERVPARTPNLYEFEWYRHVYGSAGPVKSTRDIRPALGSWFSCKPMGRLISRSKKLVSRVER